MSGFVDDLVEAVLSSPKSGRMEKNAGVVATPVLSEWEKLANELEKQAEAENDESAAENSVKPDSFRMKKLAMAAILDVVDDPRSASAITKLATDAQQLVKVALAEPDTGSVGELAQLTNADGQAYVKHKVAKGRTLFEKIKTDTVSAPAE